MVMDFFFICLPCRQSLVLLQTTKLGICVPVIAANKVNTNKMSAAVKKVLKCYIVYTAVSETWTLSRQAEEHLATEELWFVRNIQRIPCMDKKVNQAILQVKICLAYYAKKLTGEKNMVSGVTSGKLNGKKGREGKEITK